MEKWSCSEVAKLVKTEAERDALKAENEHLGRAYSGSKIFQNEFRRERDDAEAERDRCREALGPVVAKANTIGSGPLWHGSTEIVAAREALAAVGGFRL